MLFVLTATFVASSIIFSIFLLLLMFENYRKNKKLLAPDIKILLSTIIILAILIAPLHFARKAVEKNIEMETNYTQLDTENCYMITSMSKNCNTLFICRENTGELRYV